MSSDTTQRGLQAEVSGAPETDSLANAETLNSASAGSQGVAPIRPGDNIGRYRVIAILGRGGMGVVYRAHDPQLDRQIALKLLIVGDEGPAGRARLLREAKAAARVHHPHVVTVHDAGEIDGRVFVAMELVDGVTLRAWLDEKQRPWQEVLHCMIAAGEGLAAAHSAGLVHRDFKPENVIVEVSGRVRVLDFGLARDARSPAAEPSLGDVAGDSEGTSTITQAGAIVGTPAYMAPEQFSGIPADARTDQFSFCVTLHEGLYGVRPFAGERREELLLNALDGNVVPCPPSVLRSDIYALIRRGLSTAPRDRHPTMDDLLARLRAALLWTPAPPRSRARVAIMAVGVAAGVAALVAGIFVLSTPERAGARLPVVSARAEPPSTPLPVQATPPPSSSPTPELVLPLPAEVGGAALARLFAHTLPPSLTLTGDAVGLRVRGEAPGPWIPLLQAMISGVDHGPEEVPPSAGPFAAPDDRRWMLFYLGAEERDVHAASLRSLAGIVAVHLEDTLPYVLAEGSADGLARAREAAAALARPRYRKWCYQNENMGDQRCHVTKRQCEIDANHWAGPGEGRRSCRGVL